MTAPLRLISPIDLGDTVPAVPRTGVPIFELVDPRTLFVDPSYQRGLSPASIKHIHRIAAAFDWTNFNPPICSFEEVNGDTVLKVINGQHTAIAAASNPHIAMIPVMIVEAPVSILDRSAFQCAWIDGRDDRGIPMCCGRSVMRFGVSWCEPHARRVILPAAWETFTGGISKTGGGA